MRKIRGCAFALSFIAAGKAIVYFCRGALRFVVWALVFFGLWAVAGYALFGFFLFLFFGFDPFAPETLSYVYLVGFGLSVLLALLLSFRHLIADPWRHLKSSFLRYNVREETKPDPIPKKRASGHVRPIAVEASSGEGRESFKAYMSAVERDTLIHEYPDRYEVFCLSDGVYKRKKVEYKDEEGE